MRIAARTGATVQTEEGPISANSTASSTNGQGQVTEWQREQTTTSPSDAQIAGAAVPPAEPAAEPEPAPEPAAVAANEPAPAVEPAPRPVGTSGVQDQPESVNARAELPRTASPLALSGLMGLLSLAGAFGLRMFRG
jgi:hypothetical protein